MYEFEELQDQINKLQRRIENLEAIAAGSPDDFNSDRYSRSPESGIGREEDYKAENESRVAQMSRKQKQNN